jgi:hypothetical protein
MSNAELELAADVLASVDLGQYRRHADWLLSGDTGSSSIAIFRQMTGRKQDDYARAPWDAYDFGRCVRLLNIFPEWRLRLEEMRQHGLQWSTLVARWKDVETWYTEFLLDENWRKFHRRYDKLLKQQSDRKGVT